MRFTLNLGFAPVFMALSYVLGWVASYDLDDHRDVASAALTLCTVLLGLVCGAVGGAILAAKPVGLRWWSRIVPGRGMSYLTRM